MHRSPLLLTVGLVVAAVLNAQAATAQPSDDYSTIPRVKSRVIIETDAPGGDPDDEASLTRFFLYMNEWDVEGMVATRPKRISRSVPGKKRIMQFIDDYETVLPNLRTHADGWPSPDHLRDVTVKSYGGKKGTEEAPLESTSARDHVIDVIDKDDPRPVWYLNWGAFTGGERTALDQAMDYVKKHRSAKEYKAFADKVHYVQLHRYEMLGKEHLSVLPLYMDVSYPEMDGGWWYHRWEPITTAVEGFDLEEDLQTDHGPLVGNYTIPKEGDTPTFMHLIPTGLHVPYRPGWGSWSGRFGFDEERSMWLPDQRDAWQGTTNRDNTLARWAKHIQHDFMARADWAVAESYDQANHAPDPHLQGDGSRDVLYIKTGLGESLRLSAEGTTDPDEGDELSYQWTYYPEPGSYDGEVTIENAQSPQATVHVPSDSEEQTIHVVLQVTDDGEPSLTRYRRAVIMGDD